MVCPICNQHNVIKTGYRVAEGYVYKCLDCGSLVTINDGRREDARDVKRDS